MSERTPGWYTVKFIEPGPPGGGWHLGDGWYLAHLGERGWDKGPWLGEDAPFSKIGPRILPPGSDPSPAPCLDAKEMMRDVFTSWLKHRAAILTSPAEPAAPAHTTDAMERARALWEALHGYDPIDFIESGWAKLHPTLKAQFDSVFAAITSAVEQERQEIRRLRDCVVVARWRLAKGRGLWNGPCHECDTALERALTGKEVSPEELAAIRSRSAEPPSPGQKIIEGLTEALAHTKGEVSARYQCGHWHRNPEEARACVAEPPNAKGGE